MRVTTEPKTHFLNLRVTETLNTIIREASKSTGLSVTDILELGTYEVILNIKDDLKYKDIDLKELSELLRFKKLRTIQSIERKELKSKHLFIDRVKRDIILYCVKKKSKNQVIKLLEIYKKEGEQYKDNEDLLKEINEYIEMAKSENYLIELKNYLESDIKAVQYLQNSKFEGV